MAYKPYKDISIPKGYTSEERNAIAQDVVDFIVKRTLKGVGTTEDRIGRRRNYDFPGTYSESYAKSVEFRAGGKRKGNINLKLSFDMLNSLENKGTKDGTIRVGVDSSQSKKAEGNERGTYGGKSENKKHQRKFINITNNDLKTILKKYPQKDKGALFKAVAAARARNEAAKEAAEASGGNDNG